MGSPVVQKGTVVTMAYEVRPGDSPEVIEEAKADQPTQYIHGFGNLLVGLERRLEGFAEGGAGAFTVPPEEAYGPHDPDNTSVIPRRMFPADVKPGSKMLASLNSGDKQPMTVLEVGRDTVRVDLNHPLAGKPLHFRVAVISVRPAGTNELWHGKILDPEIV